MSQLQLHQWLVAGDAVVIARSLREAVDEGSLIVAMLESMEQIRLAKYRC